MVFPNGVDSGKGQHSPIPSNPRLRVRPPLVLLAPVEAAKCLQKFSFWRRPRDSPGLCVRQDEKNESGTKSSGIVNTARGLFVGSDEIPSSEFQ